MKRLLQVIVAILLIPFIILAVVGALARKVVDLAVEKIYWW